MNILHRNKLIIFIFFITSLNFLFVYITSDKLVDDLAFGRHTISLYAQLPFLTLCYILLSTYFTKNHQESLFLTILTIIPSLLILTKYSLNEITFYEEDNFRYDLLAKYFISNKTIFAEDAFTVQPGYPYYLVILINIFGDQTRLTQLLNILLCFFLLTIFINLIKKSEIQKKERYFIYYLLFSSTLFLSQNILFSIAEWLTFSLCFLSGLLIKKKQYILLAILLGYMVLLRTNLVLINSFFILLIFFYVKKKMMLILYFIIITFPFLHNYFIHGDLSVFITSNIVDRGNHTGNIMNNPFEYTLDHFLSYLALSKNYLGNDFFNNTFIISILSLPFFFIFFIRIYFISNYKFKIILFLLLFLSAGVTFFHGWAYYPRFQLTNYLISLIYFLSIRNLFMVKTK